MVQLVLGTAQWGTGYGITSQVDRIADNELARIVQVAREAGITAVDTASVYGDAQRRLRPWAADFTITTKVPGGDPRAIQGLIEASLDALGLNQVETVLLHDWDALDDDTAKQAAGALEQSRHSGLIRHAGVSVYEAIAIQRAADAFEHLDAIQVPANALDRRLDESEPIIKAREQGVRIAVRSIFLQGLLIAPSHSNFADHPDLRAYQEWAAEQGRSPLEAALAHARALPWADEIVVGATSSAELAQILAASQVDPQLAPVELASADLDLIDPRRWKRR